MALAERFGALDLGLPAVFLFYSDTRLGESSKPKPLIEGDGEFIYMLPIPPPSTISGVMTAC